MRLAALVVVAACGRIGFDALGDGGGVSGDGPPIGSGSIAFVAGAGSNVSTTGLSDGVKAGDLVVMGIAYSGATGTVFPMEADGDLVHVSVDPVGANQLHFGLYYVIIGADHATELFGAVINPTPSEVTVAVAQYRGAGAYLGESAAEFSGSSTASLGFLFGAQHGLAVVGLAAGAMATGPSAGFASRIAVPGSAIRTLVLEDMTDTPSGSISASLALAAATDWGMDAATFQP